MLKILCCNVFSLVTGMLRWGFDGRGCPCTGEFDYRGCQIPTMSLPCPGRGEVGHTIDRCISVGRRWAVGSRTSGTALVGSISSFSRLKSYAGGVPEERFSKELGVDLKRSECMNAPADRHQTVCHLLLTCHYRSLCHLCRIILIWLTYGGC